MLVKLLNGFGKKWYWQRYWCFINSLVYYFGECKPIFKKGKNKIIVR